MLLAALCAEGESTIDNVGQIERGYERIDERLRALGADSRARRGPPDAVTCMAPSLDVREAGRWSSDFAELGVIAHSPPAVPPAASARSRDEPVREVMARWTALRRAARRGTTRLATATQVHGAGHRACTQPGWRGWLRGPDADGHLAPERGTAMAVTVADCVPVFIAHPRAPSAALHSGWRGTAARITEAAIAEFVDARAARRATCACTAGRPSAGGATR